MSFFDIENPDSLPLSEPAPGVDILVTQCPCKEEVLVANGIQARCRKVETETEKQARLNCLREEKSLKRVATEKRKCIRDRCRKEVEASGPDVSSHSGSHANASSSGSTPLLSPSSGGSN
jgi:hypothetical protein